MAETVIGSEEGKEERAVPGLTDLGNVCKHIARYNLALLYADKKEVLDVACGSGYGSFLLGMVANKVTAVDCSRVAIDYAKAHFGSPKIEHIVGDATTLTCSVEVVVSFETIEHLEDLKTFESAVMRYLKPGGKIVYSVPLNEAPGYNPYHKHLFTYQTARTLFSSLKLTEEFIQHGINFYNPKQVPLDQQFLAYVGVAQRMG